MASSVFAGSVGSVVVGGAGSGRFGLDDSGLSGLVGTESLGEMYGVLEVDDALLLGGCVACNGVSRRRLFVSMAPKSSQNPKVNRTQASSTRATRNLVLLLMALLTLLECKRM